MNRRRFIWILGLGALSTGIFGRMGWRWLQGPIIDHYPLGSSAFLSGFTFSEADRIKFIGELRYRLRHHWIYFWRSERQTLGWLSQRDFEFGRTLSIGSFEISRTELAIALLAQEAGR